MHFCINLIVYTYTNEPSFSLRKGYKYHKIGAHGNDSRVMKQGILSQISRFSNDNILPMHYQIVGHSHNFYILFIINENTCCLSFLVWLILFSIRIFHFVRFVANNNISLFLYIIFHHLHVLHLLLLVISSCIYIFFHGELGCSKFGSANISFVVWFWFPWIHFQLTGSLGIYIFAFSWVYKLFFATFMVISLLWYIRIHGMLSQLSSFYSIW